jgi:hypothetical protein
MPKNFIFRASSKHIKNQRFFVFRDSQSILNATDRTPNTTIVVAHVGFLAAAAYVHEPGAITIVLS